MSDVKCIGVLTGGGDAPGLNPAIKALVYRAAEYGIETVGLLDGWRSLLDRSSDRPARVHRVARQRAGV